MIMSALALPLLLLGKKTHIGTSTSRTPNPIRPPFISKVLKAVIGVGKVDNCLLQGLRGFAVVFHRALPHLQGQNIRAKLICQVYFCPDFAVAL
jgi:hypothetical protein